MRIVILICAGIVLSDSVHSQNTGIGTTSPRAKLEVAGVSGIGNTSAIFGSDGTGISLQTNWPTVGFNQYRDLPTGNGNYMASGYAAIQYMDPNSGTFAIDMLNTGPLNNQTPNGIRAITISNAGNVGIKTGSMNATLYVPRGNGVDGTAVFAGVNNWSHFNYSFEEDTYIRSGKNGGDVYFSAIPNGNVYFGNGASRVGISEPIGTVLSSTLQIGTGNITPNITLTNEYNHFWDQRFDYAESFNPPGYFLEFYYMNNYKGSFYYGDGVYFSSSDKSLKTGITPLETVLGKIKNLNPVSFEMKDHNPNHVRSIGFIAQEVKPYFPNLVQVIDDHARKGVRHTDLHTMNYTGFHVIAIKALQEQYQQILDLQKEQEDLMQRLIMLQKKATQKL